MRDQKQDRERSRQRKRKKRYLLPFMLLVLAILFGDGRMEQLSESVPKRKQAVQRKDSSIEFIQENRTGESSLQEEERQLARIDENNRIYHYFPMLNEQERAVYAKIVNGLNEMDKEIKVHISEERLEKVMRMIFADHPEIFWTEGSYQFVNYGFYISLNPIYNCDAAAREEKALEMENEVIRALEQIQAESSQYECIRKTFQYLIDTVEYVTDAPDNQNIYSALVHKKTVCAGYAKATQYLLQRMGITALYVTGTVAGQGDHAWNIVQCDGNYYQVDTTFGDPNFIEYSAQQMETLPEEFLYDYFYLCCSDELMYRDRTVEPNLTVPVCASATYQYDKMYEVYFEEYSQQVVQHLTNSILDGKRCWFCRFSNQEAYQQMFTEIQNGLYSRLVVENSGGLIQSVETYFSYREETYVMKLWY